MATLFGELKRRGVIRAGLAYLAIAWVILQVFDIVSDILQLPGWLLQLSLIVMIIGFPIALVLA